MRETLTSTRRSDEISLRMNAKPLRSRSRNSGVTRMPVEAADDASPARTSRSLRQHRAAVGVDDDHRVHALLLDVDPAAVHAAPRALVGRRVEVVGHAAVAIGDAQERVPLLDGVAAERDQLFEQAAQAGVGRRRDLELQLREIVVGAADLEMQDLELAAVLDHRVEDVFRICESIKCPSAWTTTVCGDVSDMVGSWIIATDFLDNAECVAAMAWS